MHKRGPTPASASAETGLYCLRRSTRRTSSREVVKSTSLGMETPPEKEPNSIHPNTRKPEHEKKDINLPVKRKLEILEREDTSSSPLRRSDRGKKRASLASSDFNNNRKITDSPDVQQKKIRTEKCVKQLAVTDSETSEAERQVKRPNGREKKEMSGHAYKVIFSQRKRKHVLPDLVEDLERPEKMLQGDGTSLRVNVSNPVEDEVNGAEECTEKTEGECVERDCEEGKEQSVSKANTDNAPALENHGELETPCLKTDNPREALDKPSQENGVNALSGSMIIEESVDDSKRLLANHTLVVDLHFPEVRSLPDCNVVKGTGLDSLPSSECEKDNYVGTCGSCHKRPRLNYDLPKQELCFCSIAPTNDLLEASRVKDNVELAQCNDSLYDALIDGNPSTCAICKLDENLIRCDGKGCKQSFHLSCLDIPLDDGLPGVLHCFSCVKKKIRNGVQSMSLGIEAIWNAQEVEVRDDKGLQMEKLFFVKYKGLSHIHNHWLPETRLLLEASTLVLEFNKQKQDLKWNGDWIRPDRIIKKRLVWFPKHWDNSHGDTSKCQYEWLVKWVGLDYEHATWELENESFFRHPQFQNLLKEFEDRHHRAKDAVSSSSPEKSEKQKIVKLPAGCSYGDDQQTIDKLFEFWSKGQNAIVIDDKKRLANLILFIASLVSDVTQPFLIISSPSELSAWEAEFSRLAPDINVVVYSGNRDNRKIIRNSEFYTDRDSIMLQVLITSVEAVVEDIEVILPRWEAIIIDECQDYGISKHFEQIKPLTSAVKILLFNGQLEESTDEHLNLISLIDSPENLISISGLKGGGLRERLSPFIAYEYMPDSSRFIEYWVPVSTSNVQLEQYCFTLLSNSTTLRSSSIKNIVEALHDILISTKKCCDHPYLVDSSLQGFLTKDLPPIDNLDVGVKASGKLQLLDTVLSEIRSLGKRVLILYKSIRSAGISTGDILDDFLRQRFGVDSYERVDVGVFASKRQEAINKFNDKGSGRFVLLLEKRACSSAIKLTSVDAVFIFDSDWNIMSDSRALHKLSTDSYPEPIKVFRIFTSGTLEEKVLDLATNHVILDSNLQNISRSTIHMLLMWGASHLFSKLDEFHVSNASKSGANLCTDISMLKDVSGELLVLLHNTKNPCKNSLITKVRQTGVTYSKNVLLFGQLEGQSINGKEPHLFWKELLEGKNPCWRYLPVNSQRNRKRVQCFSDLPENPHDESGDVTKKTINNSADAVSSRTILREASEVDSVEGINLCVSQKNLYGLLMPTISELCQVLQISEDVKTVGQMFLEYIINNHQISSESESILQALQISLIWIAASLLEYKLDRKQSLDVAKQQLGFSCTKEKVRDVYFKLRDLKKTFKKRSHKFKEMFSRRDVSKDHLKQISDRCENLLIENLRDPEEEIQEFNRIWEEEREQIDDDHRAELAVKCPMYSSASALRLDKLKMVDDVFAKKLDQYKRDKELRLQELKRKQLLEKADSRIKHVQESVVSLSREKICHNKIETTEMAPSINPITAAGENKVFDSTLKIPTIPLPSLCETGRTEKQLGNVCCSNDASGNNTVGDNRLSIAEQIPDSAIPGAKETEENIPIKFDGGVNSSDISKPSGEFNKDSNQRNHIDSVDSGLMGNCSDEANSFKHDLIHTKRPLVTSLSVQILESPAQDGVSPQKLDECSRPSTSAEILDGDAPGCGSSNRLEHINAEHQANADVTSHTNYVQGHENSDCIEQALVQPLHPTSVEVVHLDSHAKEIFDVINPELTGPQPHVEQPPPQNRELSVLQYGENMLQPLSTRVVDEVLNHDGAQMGNIPPAYTHFVGFGTHHPSRCAQYMDLSAQPQPLQSDPLQIEYERVHKEAEEASKLHENAKLLVRSEYEKEITEVHRKYEAMLKGVETEYFSKMKEWDAYNQKVHMNKILAEIFRNYFVQSKPSVSSGVYQVPTTNYQQQRHLLSSQPRRTSTVSGFPIAVQPASRQQNTMPSVPAPSCSTPYIACMQKRQHRTRPIGNIPVPPAVNQQNAVPNMLAHPRSFPIIGSLHMSQNRTSPNIHPIGNFSVSSEGRGPAPHLRTVSTSAPGIPSVSQVLPDQEQQRQPPFSAIMQVPSQLPLPSPPQQPPMQPPCHMGFQNSSVSAMGLLNVETLPGVQPPNILPREPSSGSSFAGQYLSQGGVHGGDRVGGVVNLECSSVSTDVVYLSDDE